MMADEELMHILAQHAPPVAETAPELGPPTLLISLIMTQQPCVTRRRPPSNTAECR